MQRGKLMLLIKAVMLICFSNFIIAAIYAQDNKSLATVYFIRTIGARSAWSGMCIFADSQFQCKINDNRYFYRTYTPGLHLFSLQGLSKKYNKKIEQIPLQLEAGKTYYFQVSVMYGVALINSMYLKEVTQNTANLVIPKLKEDISCKQ